MSTLLISLVLTSTVLVQAGPQDEKELIWGTTKPLECGIERETPADTMVGNYFLENGLEVFTYDTNGDGEFDVAIMLPQGDINRYPQIYMFDRDYDGDPDMKYEDTKRDGTCSGIRAEFIGDGVTGEKGEEA